MLGGNMPKQDQKIFDNFKTKIVDKTNIQFSEFIEFLLITLNVDPLKKSYARRRAILNKIKTLSALDNESLWLMFIEFIHDELFYYQSREEKSEALIAAVTAAAARSNPIPANFAKEFTNNLLLLSNSGVYTSVIAEKLCDLFNKNPRYFSDNHVIFWLKNALLTLEPKQNRKNHEQSIKTIIKKIIDSLLAIPAQGQAAVARPSPLELAKTLSDLLINPVNTEFDAHIGNALSFLIAERLSRNQQLELSLDRETKSSENFKKLLDSETRFMARSLRTYKNPPFYKLFFGATLLDDEQRAKQLANDISRPVDKKFNANNCIDVANKLIFAHANADSRWLKKELISHLNSVMSLIFVRHDSFNDQQLAAVVKNLPLTCQYYWPMINFIGKRFNSLDLDLRIEFVQKLILTQSAERKINPRIRDYIDKIIPDIKNDATDARLAALNQAITDNNTFITERQKGFPAFLKKRLRKNELLQFISPDILIGIMLNGNPLDKKLTSLAAGEPENLSEQLKESLSSTKKKLQNQFFEEIRQNTDAGDLPCLTENNTTPEQKIAKLNSMLEEGNIGSNLSLSDINYLKEMIERYKQKMVKLEKRELIFANPKKTVFFTTLTQRLSIYFLAAKTIASGNVQNSPTYLNASLEVLGQISNSFLPFSGLIFKFAQYVEKEHRACQNTTLAGLTLTNTAAEEYAQRIAAAIAERYAEQIELLALGPNGVSKFAESTCTKIFSLILCSEIVADARYDLDKLCEQTLIAIGRPLPEGGLVSTIIDLFKELVQGKIRGDKEEYTQDELLCYPNLNCEGKIYETPHRPKGLVNTFGTRLATQEELDILVPTNGNSYTQTLTGIGYSPIPSPANPVNKGKTESRPEKQVENLMLVKRVEALEATINNVVSNTQTYPHLLPSDVKPITDQMQEAEKTIETVLEILLEDTSSSEASLNSPNTMESHTPIQPRTLFNTPVKPNTENAVPDSFDEISKIFYDRMESFRTIIKENKNSKKSSVHPQVINGFSPETKNELEKLKILIQSYLQVRKTHHSVVLPKQFGSEESLDEIRLKHMLVHKIQKVSGMLHDSDFAEKITEIFGTDDDVRITQSVLNLAKKQ